MTSVFGTYNLLNYGTDATRAELNHQVIDRWRAESEAAGDGFVLAVQEVIAGNPGEPGGTTTSWWGRRKTKARLARHRLAQLGEATGLHCEYAPGKPAIAVGNHRFHVGLLWSDGITPAGGWGAYAGVNVWHALSILNLDVGAREPIKHASFHAAPFGLNRRADEAERVLAAMTRPDDRPPGLVGGDWNAVSADRVTRTIRGEVDTEGQLLYDHDPYLHDDPDNAGVRKEWHPDFVYQCTVTVDDRGRRTWAADRRPGEILSNGGLRDVAAALDAPWQTTVGHWPEGDPYGRRRIDAIRVTDELVPALRAYSVDDSALALSASDHLPVSVSYEPRDLAQGRRS